MRLSTYVPAFLTFVAASGLALVTANYSVQLVEERSEIGVRDALDQRSLTWAEVAADGLQVTLAGIAPSEALRFQALTTAGSIVDAARVIDDMQVAAQAAIAPPRFSAEILRNDSGISIIGLIPATNDREDLIARFEALDSSTSVADLLETADYPVPDTWDTSMAFALSALRQLPRAKVSVQAGRVQITAISGSKEEKLELERSLRRSAPPDLGLTLNIAAPRPVLTPFTLRFVKDSEGSRFDACSADSEKSRAEIVKAALDAGLSGSSQCTVGMGVPTPRWSEAVALGIAAVEDLGGGSVTFSDADVALLAPEGTEQGVFDRIAGRLENALPDVFALKAVLPQKADPTLGPPEFVATLSPEGLVQLSGRMGDAGSRQLAQSYAQSLFGSDVVTSSARIVEGLPGNWPVRVLTGLEALGNLSNGAVVVTPDTLTVSGNTGDQGANARIAQLLAAKLGEAQQFDIKVNYRKQLDPVASIPTPDECETEIRAIVAARKISFEPGSATIDEAALGTMNDIAEVLKKCGDLKLEIRGYTDSQGREEMNLNLSQARAQAVLNELRTLRVRTASYSAKGYGEDKPIADNSSEEGREANRRIEFHLIRPAKSLPESETTLDSLATPVEGEDASAEGETQPEAQEESANE